MPLSVVIPGEQEGERGEPEAERRPVRRGQRRGERVHLAEELGRDFVDRQAEEILDLGEEDHHGDAVGEADHHRQGDEADERAEPSRTEREEQQAGEHGCHQQVRFAVGGDDAIDDGNEGAGGAADLHPRAAQGEDEEPGDDGGPDAGRGRHATGDGKRHGERQRQHAHGGASREVGEELPAVIAVQRLDEARAEEAHLILMPGVAPSSGETR